MEKQDVKELLETQVSLLEDYQPGDLITVADIKENFQTLAKEESVFPVKNIEKFVACLEELSRLLDNPAVDENKLSSLLQRGAENLKGLVTQGADKKAMVADISLLYKEIKEFQKSAPQIKEKKEEKKKRDYTEKYFSQIVQDPKMLSQLTEEITEHLNTAQFTLLELEYDPTNEENINQVFRSFHTIKGSSSFLGLKNIEDIGHQMENLFMLVRDRKLRITQELIDVIFYGIEMLRNLSTIMVTNEFKIDKMVASFKKVDIFSYIDLIESILSQYHMKKIGEILEEEGVLNHKDVKDILKRQKATGKKFGEIAVESKKAKEEDIARAVNQQTKSSKRITYVKVSNDRLNELIDDVGELVINQSMLRQILENGGKENKEERIISQLEGITTSIKNLVLSMGMVPVAEVFNKLRVVVRNTAKELGKAVIVEIHGEETELDRNVIEAIYDPLVHMVRNSVDHGLEMPEEREEAGKDRVGAIYVSAQHKGNGIEIVVRDDGHGIEKEKIIEKALEKKLISEEKIEQMSEKDIYGLMFMPGFSTARKVTEVSGRGVGLDVVKQNIEAIRGRVEIDSQPGKFTKFTIKLPLTLAIIEGFVTQVGENRYILPFDTVEEIIVPRKDQIKGMDSGDMMLYHRNKHIPLVFSGKVFKEKQYETDPTKMVSLIIEFDGSYFGIVVDRVIGKQETVIKNLGEVLNHLSVYSGGTIFGDGAIGFVVDVEEFLKEAKKIEE
jgi:two-component system chemotaxis sensor kinase CheA